ncbi:MAG: tryptophan 7-halogenase, partial [Balneolaceae bacterium]
TERWSAYLAGQNNDTDDYPYDPDHSALHHLLDEGWMWMLRFNNDLLSAGFLFDLNDKEFSTDPEIPDRALWNQTLGKYPSLRKIFSESRPAGQPGKLIRSARLQRRLTQLFGEGWIALNHTAGFIDPLHSTGIAHTLVGLEKALDILKDHFHEPATLREQFESYQKAFFRELELIDLLVAGCYQTRRNFPLFTAWSMLYFTCTIQYEQQRLRGTPPAHFLDAGNEELFSIVANSYDELQRLSDNERAAGSKTLIERIRRKIEPYNLVGLLDDSKNNMYTHTAVRL